MLIDARDRAVVDDDEGDLLIDAKQIHDEKK